MLNFQNHALASLVVHSHSQIFVNGTESNIVDGDDSWIAPVAPLAHPTAQEGWGLHPNSEVQNPKSEV